ncbi:MAG: hypothetical protein U5L04_15925 [Trueperaceae bacterium]|nr:hypothetical protein [Trueperaceae bacterium]
MRTWWYRCTALALIVLAVGVVGVKGWLELSGPYLEALPDYPFCRQAEAALAQDRVAEGLELAEAGGCSDTLAEARQRSQQLEANLERCFEGAWRGRGDSNAGLGCAVATDLFVVGDVRDLTRQGLRWWRGDATDPVLVALSAAGIALTVTPQIGAGSSLFKFARKAGTLSDELAQSVVRLTQQRAWRPLGDLLRDGGQLSARLGPVGAARALRYADTPTDLANLRRFADRPHALLALRWGGKTVTRIDDPALYRVALHKGPDGLALATRRGTAASLATAPVVWRGAKIVYKNPDTLVRAARQIAERLLRTLSWPVVLWLALVSALTGLLRWFRAAPSASTSTSTSSTSTSSVSVSTQKSTQKATSSEKMSVTGKPTGSSRSLGDRPRRRSVLITVLSVSVGLAWVGLVGFWLWPSPAEARTANTVDLLPLNETVTGTLLSSGETVRYPFEADAGTEVRLEQHFLSGGRTRFDLIAPDGSVLFSASGRNRLLPAQPDPVVLPTSGRYTLVVDPYDANTPTWSFVLHAYDATPEPTP